MDNNHGRSPGVLCRFNIIHMNKVIVMDLGVRYSLDLLITFQTKNRCVLDDLKIPLSKVLNASLFGKHLNFYYQTKDAQIPLDAHLPIGDYQDIIDFQKIPIEIDIHIEHIGA